MFELFMPRFCEILQKIPIWIFMYLLKRKTARLKLESVYTPKKRWFRTNMDNHGCIITATTLPTGPDPVKKTNETNWWFQPIWKICLSKWVHLPQIGMKVINIWNHHPETLRILLVFCSFFLRSEVTLDDPTVVAQDGSTSMEPRQLLGHTTDLNLAVMRGGGKSWNTLKGGSFQLASSWNDPTIYKWNLGHLEGLPKNPRSWGT